MKKIFILVMSTALMFFASDQVLAEQTYSLEIEKINPNSSQIYRFKRLKEKTLLKLKFTPTSKADYLEKLLDKRLAELKYVIEEDEKSYFENATKRYAATAGQLTELIANNLLNIKASKIKEKLALHAQVLILLQQTYVFNTAEWRFLEDDINYLKSYSDQLSGL